MSKAVTDTLTPLPPTPAGGQQPAQPTRTVSRWAMQVMLAMLLIAWVSVLAVIGMEYRESMAAQARHNTNLARAFQEQTVRVVAAVDQATIRLRDAVRNGDDTRTDLAQFANETGMAPTILVQLSLVGPDGRFIGSNLDPDGIKTGHVDLSTREHIRIHLAPDSVADAVRAQLTDGLFIGKPVLGKVSGRWTIQLSRRIDGPDGRVRGVVVASLDPSYFENIYRSVELGRQGGVTLVGADRVIRARVIGDSSLGMGASIGASSPLVTHGWRRSGDFVSLSTVDAVERIVGYHRIDDYPLYVLVASSTEESLADWQTMRNIVLLLTALLSAAVIAAAWIFLSNVRRLEASNIALIASEARAQSANQAKTDFLAAISHELRTPLTSIRGFAELMEKRIEQPKFKDQAGMIRRAAEHLNTLLSEILDFAKVEAGAMRVGATAVAIRPLVRGTAEFFGVSAAEKGLELRVHIADDVPETLVADELRLKQVLGNLLSNALKFTAHGHVAIEVERDATQMRLHVSDTGPGIPAEQHALIFERFQQADSRVAHQHGGTGLGLALSRSLAELMGGTLVVTSTPGEGSRFTLTLPLGTPA
jgi:signal transduction histidine kinase